MIPHAEGVRRNRRTTHCVSRARAKQKRSSPRRVYQFLSFLAVVAAILVQSGCAGVTKASTPNAQASTETTATTPSGALSASPASVAFGNVPIGSSSNQSLTLTNTGSVAVTISQASASGAPFTLSGVSLPATLAAGQNATFTATFSPTAQGVTNGSAAIASAQLSAPMSVSMTGTGTTVLPTITSQPAAIGILVNQTATFSVTAAGTAPFTYQWRKNGTSITGATSSSYTTPAETTADNGAFFSVMVNNVAGSIISNSAMLTVTTAPVVPSITTQPASQTTTAGNTATFSVVAAGTSPLSYQWKKNGTAISGATALSYTTPAEVTSDNGALFTVTVTNTAGSVTSNSATLTVNPDPVAPTITSQPASATITAGQTTTFSVAASGTAPLSYQWKKNGSAIGGATASSYTTPAETTADNGAQFVAVVTNSAGTATSNTAILTVNPTPVAPSIATQPSSQTITAGNTATFSVVASGTAPLSYQWKKNGTSISGATSSSYTTPAETTADNGALFTVVVSNTAGNATSNAATLTVNAAPVAPSITTQPSSQSITAGNTATFSVTASGTAPLSYQWKKNGASIGGATSSSYTTPTETTADNGALFTVVVTNTAGSATSNAATLTVNAAPVAPSITTQPSSQSITAGNTATFSVVASGTAPLSYQWTKNGTAIGGATSSSYTTPAETTADNGALFTVVVTNTAGSATSNAATLTVNAATPGALNASTGTLPFGSVVVNSSSQLTVNFTNAGSANITISNVAVNGAGFSGSGVSVGQIVGPGQMVTLTVTFAPTSPGTVTGASAVVTSNASNSPATVTLTGTGATAGSHSVTLDWSESGTGVSGYNMYRATSAGGPFTVLNGSLIATTEYVDSSVVSGQTYYYIATMVNTGGVESGASNTTTATIP